MNDYFFISHFEKYGTAKKYTIDKNILRSLWVTFFVIIPFVTPLSLLAKKVIRKDIKIIMRFD